MAPVKPDSSELSARAAVFVEAVAVPGLGHKQSLDIGAASGLSLSVGPLGLLIRRDGATVLVPLANLKQVYLA